ncbi:hypothetical protein [Mycobacterium sp. IDR2000157661]|uniref:hypothetical protein n=1 Tax=Mycobacterium sp. IDR2000157661 TaxID=2867005 RepID=UPI001EEA3760|nr:hypothetical protein [Mycobacterium sp. IDR2000157661]ULE31975.1 hypothetical protein K3G64_17630 [Mycobacterium sp. IDR2000157661]
MLPSARSAARLLLAATASAALAFGVAVSPAAAQPADSEFTGPTIGGPDVLPVVGVLDGMWREYVPPNAVPPATIGQIDGLIDQFVPTTTEVRDFFGFLQQFPRPGVIRQPAP